MSNEPTLYRKDIDGLRTIAVVSVIFFHLGCLPNGYLGVDVFFVISGFLITSIIYKESLVDKFSLIQFYLRRTRRIIPLVLVVNICALLIGCFVMLPDDLENLSQSVIATNLFGNNILQLITTSDYWDIINDYKPLMHTWSLGIEEQFYFIYPLIFLIFRKKNLKLIFPILIGLTILSLLITFLSNNEVSKFYLIHFRFFELSVGGLGAIYMYDKKLNNKFLIVFVLLLFAILLLNIDLSNFIKIVITVFLTLIILISNNNISGLYNVLMENKLMTGIGKISFSLYMWHQLILSYLRYLVKDDFSVVDICLIFLLIVVVSYFSYRWIEQPFRNKSKISTKFLLLFVSVLFLISTFASFYVYTKAGVLKDFPELEIYSSNVQRGMHSKYNHKIYELDKPFESTNKTKVFIVGDSFARDWANVLKESKFGNKVEISYFFKDKGKIDASKSDEMKDRFSKADYIFFSELSKKDFYFHFGKFKIDLNKIRVVGTKNFGTNNGIYYNNLIKKNYYLQRTKIDQKYIMKNDSLRVDWDEKFIDLISYSVDKNGNVQIFDNKKFISQDCRHLTRQGAIFFANKINFNKIFN